MSLQDLISSVKKDKETKSQASQPSRTSGLQSLIDKTSSLSASKPEVKSPVNDMYAGQELTQGKITPKAEPMKEGFWTKALKVALPKSVENFFGLDQTPEQKKATEEFKAKYENKFAVEDMAKLEKEIDPITGKLPTRTSETALREKDGGDYLPIVSSLQDAKEFLGIYKSAKRVESGENTIVDDYRLAKFLAEGERDSTFGAKVTDILTGIIPFAGELALTGGVYNFVKKVAEKSVKKTLETTAIKSAKRQVAERILTKSIGNVAGATVQTIPARFGAVTAGAIQNMTPEYQFTKDEAGKFTPFITAPGDNPWLAVAKSFGDQWVEVVSEHSGGIFNEAISPLKNQLLKLGAFKSLNKLNSTLTSSKFMDLVKLAGWNGIFAEMGEEYIGATMRGFLTQVGLSEEGFKFPNKEEFAVMLVSFSVPGVMIGAVNKGLQADGSGSFKEEVPAPTEDGTVPPPPPRDVATEAEMVIGGRDMLAVGQGSPELGSDLITGLQLKLDEYHKEMEEMVMDIKDTDDSSLANIKVVQYPDGKWGSSYEINTAENGVLSGFTSNKLSNSREEAITIAKDNMLSYANQNADQADFNTLINQIDRVEPTSDVGIEVRKGEREVSTEKKDHKGLAVSFIKPYAERGDTLKSLKEGQGGVSSSGESVSIGGYANGKRVSTDNIVVEYQGKTQIFPLKAIFDEIKTKQKKTETMQGEAKPMQKEDIKKGAKVRFHKISKGKTVGLEDEVWTVDSFIDSKESAGIKILLINENGRELWTTPESISLVGATTQKEEIEPVSTKKQQKEQKIVKKEVVQEKKVEETKKRNVLPSTKKLAPSQAVTQEQKDIEEKVALGDRYSLSKTLVGKTDFKTLIANNAEFAKNPTLTVDADKNLTFTGKTSSFKLKPKALGLNADNMKVGDKILVDTKALKAKGAPQQMRGYENDIAVFNKVKAEEEIDTFLTNEQVKQELSKYFNDGEIDIVFSKKILMKDGGEAWAKYQDGVMEFINNPNAKSPSHETVHAFLDLFIPMEMKKAYIERALVEANKKFGEEVVKQNIENLYNQYRGTITKGRARTLYGEEMLADNFIDYVKRNNQKSSLRKLWDKIIQFMRRLGNSKSATRLYEDIINKKRDFDKNENSRREEVFKMIEEKFAVTTKTVERLRKEIKGDFVNKITIQNTLNRGDVSKADKQLFEEVMKDYGDKINVSEFLNSVVSKIMPLSLIRSTNGSSYFDYGLRNLIDIRKDKDGGMELQSMKEEVNAETHIWDTSYKDNQKGHFDAIYSSIVLDYEIREVTDPETNKQVFFIVRKNAQLNESNLAENTAGYEDTRAKAEQAILDLKKIQEENKGKMESGLLGHVRVGDTKTKSTVLEVQKQVVAKAKRTAEDTQKGVEVREKISKIFKKNQTVLIEKFQKAIDKTLAQAQKNSPGGNFKGFRMDYILDTALDYRNRKDWSEYTKEYGGLRGADYYPKDLVYSKWIKDAMGNIWNKDLEKEFAYIGSYTHEEDAAISVLREIFETLGWNSRANASGDKSFLVDHKLTKATFMKDIDKALHLDTYKASIANEKADWQRAIERQKQIEGTSELDYPALMRYVFELQSDPGQARYKYYSKYTQATTLKKLVESFMLRLEEGKDFTSDEINRGGMAKMNYSDAYSVINNALDKTRLATGYITRIEQTLSGNSISINFIESKDDKEVKFSYQMLSDNQKTSFKKVIDTWLQENDAYIKELEPKRTNLEIQYLATLDKFHERAIKEEIRLAANDLLVGGENVPMRFAAPYTVALIEGGVDRDSFKVENNQLVRYGRTTQDELDLKRQSEIGDLPAPRVPASMDDSDNLEDNEFIIEKNTTNPLAELYVENKRKDSYGATYITIDGEIFEVSKARNEDNLKVTEASGMEQLPYEWDAEKGYNNPELGETVDMLGGGTFEVVEISDNGRNMTIALSDRVRTQDYDDFISDEVDNEVNEITYELKNLESKYGKIDTPAKAQKVIDDEKDNFDIWGTGKVLKELADKSEDTVIEDFDSIIDDMRSEIYNDKSDIYNDSRDLESMFDAEKVILRENGGSTEIIIIEAGSEMQDVPTPEAYDIAIPEYTLSKEEAEKMKLEFVNSVSSQEEIAKYNIEHEAYLKKIEEITEKYRQLKIQRDNGTLLLTETTGDGAYKFDPKDLNSDDARSVYDYYLKKVIPYLKKIRPDWKLVTDERGLQWYQTMLTLADKQAPEVYMAKKKKGVFTDAPAKADSMDLVRPIEMPEMVRLARLLTGETPKVKAKMRSKLGYMRGVGAGEIYLRADQFTAGNEDQTARLLAHEIGHIVDWLPDKTLSRGNLLGRLFSLRKFMNATFSKETGAGLNLEEFRNKAFKEVLAEKNVRYGDYLTKQQIRIDLKEDIKNRYNELISQTGAIKNETIKKELTAVTEFWRPYDKTKSDANTLKYRSSGKEIYADTISMLFNSPGTLEEMAPTFYTEFFDALDSKPEVKAEYFETQELLHGSTEEIYKARKEDIRKGFQKAEAIQAGFAEKKKVARKAYWERLRQQLDDINYPILKKQAEAEAKGAVIAPEDSPKFLLQEESFIDNENFLLVEDIDKNVVKPIEEAGMIIDDLGEYLLLNRIQNDRKDIANPFGFNQKNAGQQLDHLKATVGEENFNLLKAKAQYFHDLVFKSVEEAVAVGSYNKEVFETKIKPNKDTYASFQVVDYMQDYIPATIKGQVGTLKEVANPFISTILKTVALNRLNAHQRAKRGTVKLLLENFPEDIKPTKKITSDGKLSIFKPARGTGMLQLMEDGKMISYDVDPYIAESFTHDKTGDLNILVSMLDKFNNKLFKPLVTTYNLGFAAAMNPQRDFKRNYKSIPNATVFNLLSAYVKSLRSAVKYSRGQLDDFTRSLVESKAINAPVNDYNFDPREDELGRILEKYGLIKKYEPLTNKTVEVVRQVILKPVAKVLEGIRFVANTFEIVSKVAGAKVRIAGGESGKQLAYNLRNYTGTPNYKVKGLQTNTTNAIFVFSNIMKEGLKSDFRTATNPNTRSGYWWKTVKIDVLPKLFMFLASAGLLGELLKSLFDDVSEYDKSNYIIIPLGRSNGKTVYLRVPHDETGRLISATFWKMANFVKDGGNVKDLQDIFAIGAGQLPSVTPAISIGIAWEQFLTGKNPYDSFRGRYIIDDTTFQAGGGDALAKMVQWTTNNLGLTKFATYDTSKNTGVETFLQVAPFFSNILKSSNYGQQEKLNEIGQEAKQADAKQTLADREVVAKYVALAREDKATIFTASKYRKDLIMEALGGHLPQNAEEAQYADNLVIKFKRSLKRGLNDDPRVGAIISSTSNNQKLEILKSLESDMSPEEWKTFKQGLVEDQIVSAELLYRYKNLPK